MSDDTSPRTRFERVVDNLRFRMFFTGFMCLLYLLTLVLAALSFHIYPNAVYGALAYHIVLSIVTCAYSAFFLWRNLEGCTKKRVWGYFGLNLVMIIFWLAAFFALAIELGKTGNPNDSNSSNSSSGSSGSGSSSQGGQSNSKRLVSRQSQSSSSNSSSSQSNFYPAIGCVVVDLAIVFMYLVNLAYIYFRQQRLFPKYAELNDQDGHAFDSQMAENETHDEETAQQEPPNQTEGGFSSYGDYEGQDDYRPGTNYTPPPRYGAGSGSPPRPYQQQQQAYGYQAQTAYGQHPQYPQTAAHEDTTYYSRTAYSHPQPTTRVSPTPYPRESVMGYGNGAI